MSTHFGVEHARRIAACMVFPLLMTGCAVTPEQFARERHTLRDDEVCRAQINALRAGDRHFKGKLDEELHRRGVSPPDCPQIVQKSSNDAAAVAVLAVLGAALVAVAKSGGSGAYGPYTPYAPDAGTADFDWAWDQFYNQYNALVSDDRISAFGKDSMLLNTGMGTPRRPHRTAGG